MHGLRTIGMTLGFIVVAPVLYANHAAPASWALLLLNGFAWPHLARMLTERSSDPQRAENRNLMVDSIMGGAWIALMQFNLLPTVVIVTMLAMDKIAAGGHKLLFRGLAVQTVACILAGAANGFAFAPRTSMWEIAASVPFLVLYPIAISTMTYRLTQRIHRQNRLLERLNSIDSLSGLFRPEHWGTAVSTLLDFHREAGRPAVLMMIDIDHFKRVNDRHGHPAGDEVIHRVGDVIRANLRENDVAGRYGGDEFGVALGGVDAGMAAVIAERIRAAFAASTFEHAAGLSCTLSIGIAEIDAGSRTSREWIKQADAALYRAKLAGRDRVATATPSIAVSLPDRRAARDASGVSCGPRIAASAVAAGPAVSAWDR
ncbi:MAG TPA: diguanylate cyclase [Rhodanobacteraceae bacterium]|nr:diguanylate cyclase [Rhodanobacteraceae bacterium]